MTASTCTVNLNHGRKVLECRKGMTVFAALRTHKLFLPTGCGARGACGQCKVKLLRGEANLLTDNEKVLLSPADMADGARLSCQLRLSGDLDIEVSEHVFHAREFKVKIDKITPLTHDIRRFSFRLQDGQTVDHRAGQFVNFIAKPYGGVKGMTIRCFSFATPSDVRDRIDVIVRKTPNGVCTTYLFEHVKEGDDATVIAPFGDFYLRDTKAPCIWIAGGSGLSPFLGMLQDMVRKGQNDREVQLFFGAVMSRDLYYVDELREASRKYPWFKYVPALSGEEANDACSDYGLITDVVARHIPNAADSEAYLCGSPGMINACIKTLGDKGVKRENIYFDRFA